MRYYAGIGSRETPQGILDAFYEIGRQAAALDWTLRSGRAPGADSFFEKGCIAANGACEIFTPWSGFPNGSDLRMRPAYVFDRLDAGQQAAAKDSVAKYHPAPDRLSPGAMKLMARNYCQMHGPKTDSPATDLVVCYTKDGRASGGTGQAIRMAEDAGITVLNAHGYEDRPDDFVRDVIAYMRTV